MSSRSDEPYRVPEESRSRTGRMFLRVAVFFVVFVGSLAGSLQYTQSRVPDWAVSLGGGFLLLDGDLTSVQEELSAGIPPWYEYDVHYKTSTGQHYGNVFKSVMLRNALLNILWCLLLAAVIQRLLKRRT